MGARPLARLLAIAVLIAAGYSCVRALRDGLTKESPKRFCDPDGRFPQIVQVPVYSKAWQTVHDCDMYPVESTAIAMSVFYLEWRANFGDPDDLLWKSLNGLMVDYSPRERRGNAHDLNGRKIHDVSYGGLTLSSGYIWVKSYTDRPLCRTSLVHELTHVAFWTIRGTDGDPDHEGSKYIGWTADHSALINRVKDTLCTLDI